VTNGKPKLPEALTAHLDLDEPPEIVLQAWNAASEEEKREFFDRLMMEALLVDALRRGAAESGQVPRQKETCRRARWKAGLPVKTLAAAAMLIVAIGAGFHLWRSMPPYPLPRVARGSDLWSATGEPVSPGLLSRGERVIAGPGGAGLSLGGYCELDVDAGTVVVLQGKPRKEVIELQNGKLVSRITPEAGEFTVLTPRGTLEAVGTEFETTVIKYQPVKGENAVNRLNKCAVVTVAVASGLVGYDFGDLTGVLSAGMSKTFAGEAERVQEGLVALYTFAPSEDGSLPDVSGVGEALPLRLHPAAPEPEAEKGGLAVNTPRRVLRSDGPATKVVEALRKSGQMTLEVWLKPASLEASGPARIVSLSAGVADERNFTLGQQGSRYTVRLRTATVDAEKGFRVGERATPQDAVLLERHHLAVTYGACAHCGAAAFRIFVNGRPVVERTDMRGDFSTWDGEFPLLVGNESTLGRPWGGRFFLVALYSRALSGEEVAANFAAGLPRPE